MLDGDVPNFEILKQMNIPETDKNSVVSLPWAKITATEDEGTLFKEIHVMHCIRLLNLYIYRYVIYTRALQEC